MKPYRISQEFRRGKVPGRGEKQMKEARPSPVDESVAVRELTTAPEMKAAEDVQAAVWNRRETVPAHQLMAEAKNGGIVLGAFVGQGPVREEPARAEASAQGEVMVGLSHAFPGRDPCANGSEGVWLYSHMTGVLEPYRHKGIGLLLKLHQRKVAIEKGYTQVRWTFDPLYYPNARLNIEKLGGIVRTYYVDYYGELSDSFSSGIPSDRFLLEWHITSDRVCALLDDNPNSSGGGGSPAGVRGYGSGKTAPPEAIRISHTGGRPSPGDVLLGMTEPVILVPVPADISAMRKDSLPTALRWRMATREVFLHYFESRYVLSGIVPYGSREIPDDGCFRYVLAKEEAERAGCGSGGA